MTTKTWTALPVALSALLALAACRPPTPDDRRPSDRLSAVAAMTQIDVSGYQRALEPREFAFPRDHGAHPKFKLEWWYFVGNLASGDGRRFGFQLTFFRQALTPESPERSSAWATSQFYMAHFALTDVDGERFFSAERTSRGAVGLAGAQAAPFRVWIEDWAAESIDEGFLPLSLRARDGGAGGGPAAIDLTVASAKPLVLQGDAGLSQKSPEPGNASYYYSYTRMPATGTVRIGDETWEVDGSGWLDREWSTSGLDETQVGWDWFALQLDDGREVMFYQLRRRDGGVEPLSHGALVAADGGKRLLQLADVELEVTATWESPRGGVYPAGWRLRVADELDLTVQPLLADQELDVAFRYWEGAVGVSGTGPSGPVAGHGYVELVGYGN